MVQGKSVDYSRIYGPDRNKLESEGASQGPSALSQPQEIKRQQPDVKQRVLVSGDFGDGWNQVARGSEVAQLKARLARLELSGWQLLDTNEKTGSVHNTNSFEVHVPSRAIGRLDQIRFSMRGMTSTGNREILCRVNNNSSLRHTSGMVPLHVDGGTLVNNDNWSHSIGHWLVGLWGSATGCQLDMHIFDISSGTTPSFISHASNVATSAGNHEVGPASGRVREADGSSGPQIDSLRFFADSIAGGALFRYTQWRLEGMFKQSAIDEIVGDDPNEG